MEVYWPEGWDGLNVDDSKAKCLECQKAESPNEWYDGQCAECGKWVNERDSTGWCTQSAGWLCDACTRWLAALVRAQAEANR